MSTEPRYKEMPFEESETYLVYLCFLYSVVAVGVVVVATLLTLHFGLSTMMYLFWALAGFSTLPMVGGYIELITRVRDRSKSPLSD